MHCDLDLWPFDLKIYRAHPCLMGSLHVKFPDDRCKEKAVMRRKPKCGRTDGRTDGQTDGQTDMVIPVYPPPPNFVAGGIMIWSFRFANHCEFCLFKTRSGSVLKGLIPRRDNFSVIYALWPWPFDLKIYRAHPCLMGSLNVKFHDDRCKGKAVMHRKPFSVIYALWPWPLTSWPQNLKGTSLPHGESACEVSWW